MVSRRWASVFNQAWLACRVVSSTAVTHSGKAGLRRINNVSLARVASARHLKTLGGEKRSDMTLDSVADNNETAAFDLMRAVEKLSDEVLRQRLLNTIHRLNQDAHELREARDAVERVSVKLA
eukprot:gene7408-11375_t